MEIGIFSRTYTRRTLDEVLDAIVAHGLSRVHFNLASAGAASLPDEMDEALCRGVRSAFERRNLVMTSISGTFNAIHPDLERRRLDTERACRLIENCRALGTSVVSLCTGSRDPGNMWKAHPGNDLPDAWTDLHATLRPLLLASEANDVVLGIEPEINNVVNTAAKARRLLDEVRSPHLKIILDGANLFSSAASQYSGRTLEDAFAKLAPDVVMVHAKDLADPPTHPSQAAGKGRLNWEAYCRLIRGYSPNVDVILHNLTESEVPESVHFVRQHLTYATS